MAGKAFIKLGQTGIGTQTTTERNAGVSTATGTTIYNVTTESVETYSGDSDGWFTVGGQFSASGGDVNELAPGNGFKYHTFTSSGSFVVSGSMDGTKNGELLLVGPGGGGAGGNGSAGGGGAGGIVHVTSFELSAGSYTITLPAGGSGGSGPNGPAAAGGNATFVGPGVAVTALGGGGGGSWSQSGNMPTGGGSGGGGGNYTGSPGTQPSISQTVNAGAAVTNYGTNGGIGNPGSPYNGGGGGGAGQSGRDYNTSPRPSEGGNGQPFPDYTAPLIGVPALGPISGVFGGGGGGGFESPFHSTPNAGGSGGGGPSGYPAPDPGDDGVANSGGGGGAGSYPPGSDGGSGGKGICIIRYQG
jgi:hypothetical protein